MYFKHVTKTEDNVVNNITEDLSEALQRPLTFRAFIHCKPPEWPITGSDDHFQVIKQIAFAGDLNKVFNYKTVPIKCNSEIIPSPLVN